MDIKKLTIAPIVRGARSIIINEPSPQRAAMLIKESFESSRTAFGVKSMPVKKLPKALKGLVNPKTWVGSSLNTKV